MADAQISYKLDLIVRLVDTTTGRMVSQRQVIFKSDGQIVPFLRRDEGVYVLTPTLNQAFKFQSDLSYNSTLKYSLSFFKYVTFTT